MLSLIPLLPFLGFLVNATLGRRLPKGVSGGIATGAMALSFGVAAASVWQLLRLEPVGGVRAIEETRLHLDRVGRARRSRWRSGSTRCRRVMILVVTGIGTLIHLYSTAYMHDETDGEYARYFSYLNLFAAFMLVLVLGANFPVMFVGWEGVGLCSYLLIGFWFTKPSAADAGKKAFVVNRIGDFGFILGMLCALRDVRHARLPGAWPSRSRRCRPRPTLSARADAASRCCCSSARPASPRRFRSTSGCRTRWRARRRCPPSSTRRRW